MSESKDIQLYNDWFNSNSKLSFAEYSYQQGAREFAEWLPQHFDLRFSNNPSVWLDEFFNHTTDRILSEWQKGADIDG